MKEENLHRELEWLKSKMQEDQSKFLQEQQLARESHQDKVDELNRKFSQMEQDLMLQLKKQSEHIQTLEGKAPPGNAFKLIPVEVPVDSEE